MPEVPFNNGEGMQGSTDLLHGAAGDADEGAITLDLMLNGLMTKLEPLMTEWVGKGGRTFQDVREDCEREMRRLNGALNRLGTKIGDTSLAYVATDDEMTTLMGNAGSGATGITAALCPDLAEPATSRAV
jgi:WXG100 family type VII secretion target